MLLGSGPRPLLRLLLNATKHELKRIVRPFRTATAKWRMDPHFLIIGTRKGGTTSMYAYLAEHPNVLPALEKEVFFFIRHYERGCAWYRGHFPTHAKQRLAARVAGSSVITGEATANYLFHPEVPERVARMLPQIKLIAILRNPIERAVSDYHHGIRHGAYTRESRPLERLLESELLTLSQCPDRPDTVSGILGRGLYLQQLETWLRVFPREQLLVLLSEDVYRDAAAGYRKVTDFLGLPTHELHEYDALNANRYPDLDPHLRDRLSAFFRPHNDRLARFLGVDPRWS